MMLLVILAYSCSASIQVPTRAFHKPAYLASTLHLQVVTSVWLSHWSNQGDSDHAQSPLFYIGIYFALSIGYQSKLS